MLVSDVCRSPVVFVSSQASIEQASILMYLKMVGSLVVVDGKELPIGIVTDRDLALKGIPLMTSSNLVSVGEVMSKYPITISINSSLAEAIYLMEKMGIRRTVVTDAEGHVCGILSVDDCLLSLVKQMASLGEIYHTQDKSKQGPATRETTKMA